MKRLLLTLSLAAGLSGTDAVSAFTVDQIVENCPSMIAEARQQKHYQNGIDFNILRSFAVQLEKVDNTHIKMRNFETLCDFVFTLCDEDGAESTDGTRLSIKSNVKNTNSDHTGKTYYIRPITSTEPDSYYSSNYTYNSGVSVFNLDIEESEEDGITFQLPDDVAGNGGYYLFCSGGPADCTGVTVYLDFYNFDHYRKLNPEFMDGYATDKTRRDYYTSSSSSARMTTGKISDQRGYPMLVKWDTDNKNFELFNYGNLGYGTDHVNQVLVKGTFKDDGTCVIPCRGISTGCFPHLDQSGSSWPLWNVWYIACFDKNSGPYIPNCTKRFFEGLTGTDCKDLSGTWQKVDGPKHNSEPKGWVTNGGARRTYQGIEAKFGNWTLLTPVYSSDNGWWGWEIQESNYVNAPYFNMTYDGAYFDTDILFGSDITAQVELKLNDVKVHPEEGLSVDADVNFIKNEEHVDHCEIYVVRGAYANINDAGFVYHDETGHASAKYFHHNAPAAAVKRQRAASKDELSYHVTKLVSPETLGIDTDKGDYTFFVKTVYTEDSKLSPTYHSMQVFTASATTATDDITTDLSNLKVNVGTGYADIKADGPVSVYTATGVEVYNGAAARVSLTAGMYIIRSGHHSVKAMVH